MWGQNIVKSSRPTCLCIFIDYSLLSVHENNSILKSTKRINLVDDDYDETYKFMNAYLRGSHDIVLYMIIMILKPTWECS